MRQSRRFRSLQRRVEQLRRAFLPRRYSDTGAYAQPVIDRARAFRLLVHAEFESYIEDIVQESVEKAIQKWTRSGKITTPILAITASYEGVDRINDFSNYQKKQPPTITTIVHKAKIHFEYNKSQNHGIRIQNILSLLSQVGIAQNDLEAAWLGAIDNFGVARNEVAHSSGARGYVAYQTDPRSIDQASIIILSGIKDLDAKICAMSA